MIMSMNLCLFNTLPAICSMYCDTHKKGTCVWAWWLHNRRTSFVVAASHPTPNAPPAPLFRLCLGGRARELKRDENTDGIKCQIHMYKPSHIDVGTGACTALREIWLTCEPQSIRIGGCLLASLCLVQQEAAVFFCPPHLPAGGHGG